MARLGRGATARSVPEWARERSDREHRTGPVGGQIGACAAVRSGPKSAVRFLPGRQPRGPGFPTGSILMLEDGSPAPEGFTLIGSTLQVVRLANGSVRTLHVDLYRKD